ncbi:MAG TPA: hypothetical protein VGX25_27725 [Actinophytocola sp.]|uniref:hypothetical protein n=1 Tax=Actinophytocola sp. TaxID=1872138 RepID=UPI002DDD5E97|nr:hypothetical protein [Actinophytocola sp.]HEV2783190.1 hypothetical protein [Actinophytocola sp.]
MAYVEIRPVHVADLLSREGHPFAARVIAARADRSAEKDAEPREFDGRAVARRTLGVAAGAMIVMGSVVGGVLGLNNGESTHTPLAGGEPVGARPSPNTPGQPGQSPAVEGAVAPQFTNAAADTTPRTAPSGAAGEIGAPASVKPPRVAAPPAVPDQRVPTPPAPAPEQPAPNPPSSGPVQTLAEPVTSTVEQSGTVGQTLNDVVTPVTGTVDDTLQPALSLIGGLLSR